MAFLLNFGQMKMSSKRRVIVDEVVIEPLPKQELGHAIHALQTFSLFAEVDIDSFKSSIRNISRIIVAD